MRIGDASRASDLLHVGQLDLLRHAGDQCELLVAAAVNDETLRNVKGLESVAPPLGTPGSSARLATSTRCRSRRTL